MSDEWKQKLIGKTGIMAPGPVHLPTGTEAGVCNDIIRRQRLGISKYGTTVAENPLGLREWLVHAYDETLDQAIYLKRAIEEIDRRLTKKP